MDMRQNIICTENQREKPRATAWHKTLLGLLSLHRSRRALARLTAPQLHDLGLTKEEAMTESRRPVWDVATHWRAPKD